MARICPKCEQTVPDEAACSECGASTLLNDRWVLERLVGSGASGHTWRAREEGSQTVAALKELNFRKITDLKQLELFDREAAALAEIDHHGVPKLMDRFVIDEDRFVSAYIVQEFVDGGVLSVDERWSEEQARTFLLEMSYILDAIHLRKPPIVHRDIKPSNVMRREDGKYVLVDFGSITAAVNDSIGGSTVAGTLGYMAPEQLVGQASPASDFYGLGATTVAMLSGKAGHELFDPSNPESWRELASVPEGLVHVIDASLESSPKDRIASGEALRKALDRKPVESSPREAPKTREASLDGGAGPLAYGLALLLISGVLLYFINSSRDGGAFDGASSAAIMVKDGELRRTRIGKTRSEEWLIVVDAPDKGEIARHEVPLELRAVSPAKQIVRDTAVEWTFDSNREGVFALVDLWTGQVLLNSGQFGTEVRRGRVEGKNAFVKLPDGTEKQVPLTAVTEGVEQFEQCRGRSVSSSNEAGFRLESYDSCDACGQLVLSNDAAFGDGNWSLAQRGLNHATWKKSLSDLVGTADLQQVQATKEHCLLVAFPKDPADKPTYYYHRNYLLNPDTGAVKLLDFKDY